jgi:hypothetical protein
LRLSSLDSWDSCLFTFSCSIRRSTTIFPSMEDLRE